MVQNDDLRDLHARYHPLEKAMNPTIFRSTIRLFVRVFMCLLHDSLDMELDTI